MTHVTVHQVTPREDGAFLNIDTHDFYICAWTNCYENPTILTTDDDVVSLIQFVDLESYAEWVVDNPGIDHIDLTKSHLVNR